MQPKTKRTLQLGRMGNFVFVLFFLSSCLLECSFGLTQDSKTSVENSRLDFHPLPDLPDPFGVAGPIVGVHQSSNKSNLDFEDHLIVAGGANFGTEKDPKLWDLPKTYLDRAWVLKRSKQTGSPAKDTNTGQSRYSWQNEFESFRLSQPVAYSSVVSTKFGVLIMGGQNVDGPTDRAFLLSLRRKTEGTDGDRTGFDLVESDTAVPDLPLKCTAGGAAIVGGYVYLVAGEVVDESGETHASRLVWRLKLSSLDPTLDSGLTQKTDANVKAKWEPVTRWPDEGPSRMFPLVTAQHDGFRTRLYVFGGRRFLEGSDKTDLYNLKFGTDGWSYDPSTDTWKRVADCPVPIAAGTAVAYGPAHVIVPAYATGDILKQWLDSKTKQKDFDHPGFPKTALAYHTVTDTWTEFGSMPAAQVTTPAIKWGDDIVMVSGEVRPRVRSRKLWRISVPENKAVFGTFNMLVLIAYLIGTLAIGVYFMYRNKTTDDFFRGGKSVPWWAAGCSIFATMLSSITYMAIPSKAFAQDWVYALGSLMILAVAPIAIYVALPFFRRIDATSAYEYLEKRFNRSVRLIGSGSFSLFHIFRMGVVLALAALALASVTPMTTQQCVIVMGLLSIAYCTLGGIEAVIWTDTLQTGVLLIGAICCLFFALSGADAGSFSAAVDAEKFHLVNIDFGPASFTTMAIWVVIIGGLGQNLASYTADQAVVQRYMTTSDNNLAARSIWLNGLMAIPASVVFFGMGTAFWMFYRSHPEKLDPAIAADRIMPLFISQELPVGLAGLVVAGIFAAAQSTVSTSMNSGATTIVTDFMRPANFAKTEKGYLGLARFITVLMGIFGTAAGLLFVQPGIKSLFDEFIGILGLFLGVLAGLFALGATTRRANGRGSLVGALTAILVMTMIVLASKDKSVFGIDVRGLFDSVGLEIYRINGYLNAFVGISICYVVGYFASLFLAGEKKDLDGLTLWD
ncbi:MAG: sodium:solute symporter [Mariniblastus sp.]